jgi:hypothetical protein
VFQRLRKVNVSLDKMEFGESGLVAHTSLTVLGGLRYDKWRA